MATKKQLKCPDCGAPIDHSTVSADGTVQCKYCGTVITVDVPKLAPAPTPAPAPQAQQYMPRYGTKTKGVAILLAVFLGYIGGQNFYLNRIGLGVLSVLLCWTFIPYALAVIDIIRLLCMSDEEFNEKYNRIG